MNKTKIIKKYLGLTLTSVLLVACSSSTVYRIETTAGMRVYSKDKPSLNTKTGYYELVDLDGNQIQIKNSLLYKIEEYKGKK